MSKYNNSSSHIDKTVIYVFLFVFFASISVFAYRYTKYSPCENVTFNIDKAQNTVGELIKFKDVTDTAESWYWDFGDNSIASTQKEPLHVYKTPGDYTVKLIVNDICEATQTVSIAEKKEVLDPTKFPIFELQKTIKVGQKLRVNDETENASTWEWRFGETAKINANTKRASYVYTEPGLKTVSLVVNGDLKYVTKKTIEVLPLAETKRKPIDIPQAPSKPSVDIKYKPESAIKDKPSTPKLAPYISEADFKAKMMKVSKEEMSAKQFSEYFCGDINKKIVANGRNTTFLVFCEKISDKKIRIKKLEIFRDKGSNCINTITIDCRIRGLFND
ncbi:PKD domain-containing protein [Lacinutrix sp. 5H-3-7-4]|uniref:PKD domain-containing protein n=1 Tax=Lacinutrix sp. (strain 5H-3-7-4) TaxID=983544 RepID=UPI00020A38F1|nr:PKD domain-containing protein [Lacinutrix sp. 5H-3-7-4]AEH02119.1 PKD domain containing protein [Lacinutrix sp. 5H-3-7-4]